MMKPIKEDFIARMADFVQEGIWQQFVQFQKDRGVSEKLSEKWIEEISNGNFE